VTCGPHVALATSLCGKLHDLGIRKCEKGRNFLLLGNTDLHTHIHYLSAREDNRKKYFNERKVS
jgi:hypothetical protein